MSFFCCSHDCFSVLGNSWHLRSKRQKKGASSWRPISTVKSQYQQASRKKYHPLFFHSVSFFPSLFTMGLRRLSKQVKITSKHMLLMPRREPYKPLTCDRVMIENRRRLEEFEAKNAEGVVFVPDTALPPWQRSIATNLKRQATQMNFRGFRVRVADKQDEPGFPTHFR